MSRRTWRTLGGVAGLSAVVVVAWGPAGTAWADDGAPAGNNGSVRINNETAPNQDNDPHVGCSFSVSFYGYDTGNQTARLTFAGQAPTRGSGSTTLSAAWTTAGRTGGDQLDQTVPVSFQQLAGLFKGVAPAHEGYHVKLTAAVSGSQGSDLKHKVFWIDCRPAPAAAPGRATPPTSSSTSSSAGAGAPAVAAIRMAPPSGSATPLTAVEGLTLAAPATAAGASAPTVLTSGAAGGSASLPAAPTGAAVAGSSLAFTGFRALGIAGLGTGLVAGGAVLAAAGRRRRRNGGAGPSA